MPAWLLEWTLESRAGEWCELVTAATGLVSMMGGGREEVAGLEIESER